MINVAKVQSNIMTMLKNSKLTQLVSTIQAN